MAKTTKLPHNLEAERAVLGSMLIDDESLAIGVAGLSEDDFSGVETKNPLVFRAIKILFDDQKPVDPQTVHDELINLKLDKETNSPDYLNELIDAVVTPENMNHYVKLVKDQRLLRDLLLKLEEIQNDYSSKKIEDIGDFVAQASNSIQDIAANRQVGDFRSAEEIAKEVMYKLSLTRGAAVKSVTGIDTGYAKLNALTHGWQKEDLIYVGARPGMGKTALVLNFAMNACQKGASVAFFSLEMNSNQIMQRMLSNISGIPSDLILQGNLDNRQVDKLNLAVDQMKNYKLYIDDTPNCKLGDLVAKATKLKYSDPDLSLIVIDYLGRIVSPVVNKNESSEQQIAKVSISLKTLARELHVPVLVAAQLNRGVEGGDNHMPSMSDLRGSGQIEQDADQVILIFRDDYYSKGKKKSSRGGEDDNNAMEDVMNDLKRNPNDASLVQIRLDKNRQGRIGELNLLFEKAISRFSTLSEETEQKLAEARKRKFSKGDE